MTAVQSGNWKLSTGRSDDDTVVSAEAKSQPLRRNRKSAAASCQGGAPVTHASQARRRARTLASLPVSQTDLGALTRFTGYFTRRTRTVTVIRKTRDRSLASRIYAVSNFVSRYIARGRRRTVSVSVVRGWRE